MVEGSKLTELTELDSTVAQTDLIYVVRSLLSRKVLVSALRILAAQVSDSGAAGRSVLQSATAADGRTALGLGALAVLAAVGAAQITDGSVTTAKMGGDVTTAGKALLDDADAAAQRATLSLVPGTDVQAFDADLAAIAALVSTGFAAHTGAGTWAERSLAEGLSVVITNPAGVAGNPTIGVNLGVTSTATAAGTTTLTAASTVVQFFTGATTQTVQFPAANALGAGKAVHYVIVNLSSGDVTPTRAGSDTFQGGGTTDTVAGGATKEYWSNGVDTWGLK